MQKQRKRIDQERLAEYSVYMKHHTLPADGHYLQKQRENNIL